MLRVLVLGLALAFSTGAAAQLYRWVDEDGRVRYGDTPPPGVKASALKPPSSTGTAAPAAAEQDAEFRKRQVEAQKAAAESEQQQKDAQTRIDNCNRAQTALRTLQPGQRVVTTDAQGERYYLNDEELARQSALARQQVSDWCK